jgi:hypothetical protein
MRLAKTIFTIAGIWGVLVLTPLYFMAGELGRRYPPPFTHLDFYYGFVGVALAWQVAFLVIGRDPIRLRPMMVPAMLEKFGYVATLSTLYLRGELQAAQFAVAVPDFILGLLFVAAFAKTSGTASPIHQ